MVNTSQVHHTEDYLKFSEHTSNREVDLKHVNKLVKAISKKNLLHLNPIVVDDQLKVIDGQHRLAAAKELQVPIFYVVDQEITKSDIASLNSNKKNWSPMDYINYWTIEKAPGFDVLSSFLSRYPFLNPSAALRLLGEGNNRTFKEGIIRLVEVKRAELIASTLQWYVERWPFASTVWFQRAITTIIISGEYDHERMVEKIEQQPRSMVQCVSAKQYIEMLEEIYNWRMQNRARFR